MTNGPDQEFAALLDQMSREGFAAILCDELEAGAIANKRSRKKIAAIMQKRFGDGPWSALL